jgi:excisionase family DNA binding protein
MESPTVEMADEQDFRIAYSPEEARRLLGCSRGFVYSLMDMGQLRSVKLGGRRFIPAAAIAEKMAEAA